jgi:hypothetical protein
MIFGELMSLDERRWGLCFGWHWEEHRLPMSDIVFVHKNKTLVRALAYLLPLSLFPTYLK